MSRLWKNLDFGHPVLGHLLYLIEHVLKKIYTVPVLQSDLGAVDLVDAAVVAVDHEGAVDLAVDLDAVVD